VKRDHELYLIRHGVAEEHGPAWPDDSKRPLSEEGVSRLRRSGRALRQLDVSFDVILSSPLVRARQSAEILAEAFEPPPSVVLTEALAPGGSPAQVMAELETHDRNARVAIVGHEPGIGELASRLIGLRHAIDDVLEGAYLDGLASGAWHPASGPPLRTVYTAMHGVGHRLLARALRAMLRDPQQYRPRGAQTWVLPGVLLLKWPFILLALAFILWYMPARPEGVALGALLALVGASIAAIGTNRASTSPGAADQGTDAPTPP